jgi:hypothetical protein
MSISHRTVSGGAAAIAALLLLACSGKRDDREGVVAEAYGEMLYASDLRSVVGTSPDTADSAALASAFIENWLHERVLLHKAEENLTTDQKDVERQLADYRNSLIIYAYEQALVRQKLDTAISEAEIQRYYSENGKNFELKDNIVRVRWFKLREQDNRVLKKVEQQWRSDKDEDRHDLEVFLAQRGSSINDSEGSWIPFTELQQLVPLSPENPTDWLPRQSKVVVKDSANVYFVDLVEHKLKNSTSPLSMVRGTIRSILLNQRKLQLIAQMRKDLYKDALENKDIIIKH